MQPKDASISDNSFGADPGSLLTVSLDQHSSTTCLNFGPASTLGSEIRWKGHSLPCIDPWTSDEKRSLLVAGMVAETSQGHEARGAN